MHLATGLVLSSLLIKKNVQKLLIPSAGTNNCVEQ